MMMRSTMISIVNGHLLALRLLPATKNLRLVAAPLYTLKLAVTHKRSRPAGMPAAMSSTNCAPTPSNPIQE
ncbi:hypothetical protein MJO28_003127 [Puccinia striiformis f. sp. tritici]|uniref:Uncharacterized protein n=1 Tax=Puccinia striiformis f. sp. tritici TaxID=168172 RepID=A0ACC0ERI9_9BASI|nr:hypothetical protein MJO28_003127 [Puccinia striiformis f. sp. tritici]